MINKNRRSNLIIPILILIPAFSVRFLFQDPVIMNDEVGYGRWWGYLEEAKFIARQWIQGSNVEQLMVNFMGHPPLSHFLAALSLFLPFLQEVVAIHLPFQFLSSLTCVLVYYIGKNLYEKHVGLWAGLFLAFSPLFINYGRCSYPHEPLAFFMSLSILALYKGVTTNNYRYVLMSSICCGLAFSTHELSILLPIIVTTWVLYLILCKLVSSRSFRVLPKLLFTEEHYLDMAMYPAIALSMYIALFAWLWPDPTARILYIFYEYATFGTEGHPIYFMGKKWLHGPPIYAYAMYILGFTTPVELVMFVLGVVFLMKQVATLKARREDILLILWFGIVFSYFSLMVVKFVHFSVIFYPPLSIICGLGLVKLAEITQRLSFLRRSIPKKHIFRKVMHTGVICLLLISLHIASAIYVHPHYEMYFSPLVGGPKEGVRLFKLEGGGVMYREAAEYIRQHCELNSAIVFAGPALFCYYLPEHNVKAIWDHPTIDKLEPGIAVVEYLLSHNVRYVVFGLDWVQYNDKNVCYMTFKGLKPSFVFRQYGVEWVWIYRVSAELLR